MEQLDRLLETWTKLGEGERNILMTFLMRLWAGQRRHGPLTRDKKDWTYEALEEALDGCVYLSCALERKSNMAFDAALLDAETEVLAKNAAKEEEPAPDADQGQTSFGLKTEKLSKYYDNWENQD